MFIFSKEYNSFLVLIKNEDLQNVRTCVEYYSSPKTRFWLVE